MGEGFRVEPARLHEFAARSRRRQDAFGKLHTELAAAALDRDAFGHLPMVGGRIYEAYDEHLATCLGGLESARNRMSATATLLDGLGDDYEGRDQEIASALRRIEDALPGGGP
jgi:hypothetical protein